MIQINTLIIVSYFSYKNLQSKFSHIKITQRVFNDFDNYHLFNKKKK